jgi:hyperosmotically inducible protein
VGTCRLGYWSLDQVGVNSWRPATAPGTGPTSTRPPRDRAAEFDAHAGKAAHAVSDFLSDAELTGKIKSKMALDDGVRARTIDVSTTGGVVTLAGTVGSAAEHAQALRLARDTKGVGRVVDRLTISLP